MVFKVQKENNIMLLQFRFKNYKSFAEEAILDMTATNIKEHMDSLIDIAGKKILPVAAIFGANASGKSNFFQAFQAMQLEVTAPSKKYQCAIPFIFNNNLKNEPTEFEICINFEDKKYRYGFAMNQKEILEEWLYEQRFAKKTRSKEKCIFYREYDNLNFESVTKDEKKEIKYIFSMLKTDELIMTALGKRGKSLYSLVYHWFASVPQFKDYSTDFSEFFDMRRVSEALYKLSDIKRNVLLLLQEFDDAIIDLEIEKKQDDNLKDIYEIYSVHENENGEKIRFPFNNESKGTQKILTLSVWILLSLNMGTVLFIDELDAKLHPLILRYILKLYTNLDDNKQNGQLIFSSHNLVCLDSNDLRRDEIWFVEKEKQKSTMFSLYDFKTYDSANYTDFDFGKHYLNGRFGAIPFLKEE